MKLQTLNKSLVLAAIISIPSIIFAGEKVDETLTADVEGVVEIHNVRGKIRVVGWDDNQVQILGELDDLAEKLIFETQGKVTMIKVKMPKRDINRGDGSNLIINVPKGNRVDFNGISTDLLVQDLSGGIDVRTISGDIDVINVHKQLFAETVSGDIDISESSGTAKWGSVSGDIKGKFDSQDIAASSVSGDIQLHLKNFDSLSASSVSGEVWVSGQLNDSGKTNLSSVNGDITLSFDSAVNARANVKAGPGGSISNSMSSDKVQDIFPSQQKLKMTLGDGSGRIKIGTVNGSVKLRGSN